ncbi:hypothetical protein [Streptomyces sp. NPDC051219]|uniref:hypothetical protein n=1 Tax=Streptomyces sp. NPDC051219 TaxID=3155283 RepID=UPI00342B372B
MAGRWLRWRRAEAGHGAARSGRGAGRRWSEPRHRAALERAAARVAEERRAAAQAEEERQRREAEFDELVADFELAREDEEVIAAEVEGELRRVRERGQARIHKAWVVAARVVVAMGVKGETVSGCSRRLGVGTDRVKELRRLGRETAAEAGAESGAAPESGRERQNAARAPELGGPTAGASAGRPAPVRPVAAVPAPPVVAPVAPAAGPVGAPGTGDGSVPGAGWPGSAD